MKKSIFSIFMLLFLATTAAYSQVGFALGARAGANYAQVNKSGFEGKPGYFGGIYANVKFTKLAIQPEVLFSYQGTGVSATNAASVIFKQDLDVWQVHIPLLVKYYILDNPAFGLTAFVGPQFNSVLSQTKFDFSKVNSAQSAEEVYKSNNVSGVVGVGVDLPLGINVDVRYNMTLNTATKGNNGLPEGRVSTFQITVGKRFFGLGS
jgi:hypothetical protein